MVSKFHKFWVNYMLELLFIFIKFNISSWWCRKSHQWVARSERSSESPTQKKKEEDLAESTGVVPAKYPPKVKLEIFSQL